MTPPGMDLHDALVELQKKAISTENHLTLLRAGIDYVEKRAGLEAREADALRGANEAHSELATWTLLGWAAFFLSAGVNVIVITRLYELTR